MSELHFSIHDIGDSARPASEHAQQPAQAGANARQEGGAHYKAHKYETWDVILDWNLGYLDGNAVKYLSRWRLKGGVQDLKKARHYIDKLIETVEFVEDYRKKHES
jgi:hypothetical protein